VKVLLVEDDARVADFLQRGLRAEGYAVVVARTGPEGLKLGRTGEPDLVILDRMLPGMEGLEVCQQLRAAGSKVPILMLTALDTTEEKVEGLTVGADDYLSKPFAFDELLARMTALLRRAGDYRQAPDRLEVADLVLDRQGLKVQRGGRVVELTAKELALLELLMRAPGRVLSRARILSAVWGASTDPLTNVVDVYIRRLRAKIDDGSPRPLIRTVRGYGYKIDPEAGEESDAVPAAEAERE
jgi:DNA-binding response OmpR family regulator